MVYRDGLIYLADTYSMKVVALDTEGTFQRGHDIRPLMNEMGVAEEDVEEVDMEGFDVDPQGNVLFTVSSMFSAYRISPSGKIEGFGGRGSSPGLFGVVAGIRADEYGYYYITDRLRSVVIVYDSSLTFRTEFGYRGPRRGNLIVPNDLAVGNGKVYVSQSGERGVSVFRLYQESAGHKEFLGKQKPEEKGVIDKEGSLTRGMTKLPSV
jgi:outer membrane protein assembly factor BamB